MIRIGTDWVISCTHLSDLHRVPPVSSSGQTIRSISTDSRSMQAGSLFIAIHGDRFDGHDFVESVFESGAVAALVHHDFVQPLCVPESFLIRCHDTRLTMALLARGIRNAFSGNVWAVAGSNGKTTTKDLIAHLLGNHSKTLKSHASFNNDIGVPLTLFRLIDDDYRIVVLELGTNHPGEIEFLCRIAAPNAGVLTNIGEEHMEFFLNLEGVAEEEGKLAKSLPPKSPFVYASDCHYSSHIAEDATSTQSLSISKSGAAEADFTFHISQSSLTGSHFILNSKNHPDWNREFFISVPGEHNVRNATLALAVAVHEGVDPESAATALSSFSPSRFRMESESVHGVTLIRDCYNANPSSSRAALNFLARLDAKGRKLVVLGEHAEAGADIHHFYHEFIQSAAIQGMDALLMVNLDYHPDFCPPDLMLHSSDSVQEAAQWIDTSFNPEPGDILLFKASRVAQLESVAAEIQNLLSGKKNNSPVT